MKLSYGPRIFLTASWVLCSGSIGCFVAGILALVMAFVSQVVFKSSPGSDIVYIVLGALACSGLIAVTAACFAYVAKTLATIEAEVKNDPTTKK